MTFRKDFRQCSPKLAPIKLCRMAYVQLHSPSTPRINRLMNSTSLMMTLLEVNEYEFEMDKHLDLPPLMMKTPVSEPTAKGFRFTEIFL